MWSHFFSLFDLTHHFFEFLLFQYLLLFFCIFLLHWCLFDILHDWFYALNVNVSILFNLLLGDITILLCFFFLFLVICNNFLLIPVVKEKKLKLAFNVSTGAPITVVKEIIDAPTLVADKKQLKSCQNRQKQQCIYLVFYSSILFHKFLHKNSLLFSNLNCVWLFKSSIFEIAPKYFVVFFKIIR